MWRLKIWIGLYVCAAVTLAACSGTRTWGLPAAQPTIYPPAAFAHRVSTSDVDIYWNCSQPEPDVLRLDGVVQNSGGREIEFTQLEVDAADARDRYVSEAKTSLTDIVLHY